MTVKFDIAVIGAGPAGLLAAGSAAKYGAKVVLLEKMEKPARKLRITGKGRCNITNVKTIDEYLDQISPDSQFLTEAFSTFFHGDIIGLLGRVGVETVIERGQRVFPKSGKAWDVAEGLVKWVKALGVMIINQSEVEKLIVADHTISGVSVKNRKSGQKHIITAKAVIIATGGKSYPLTGSTGDGYNFAKSLGHNVTELYPSLVGLETKPVIQDAAGLKLKNVQISLYVDEEFIQREFGELDIAEYGLDGPIILKISRKAVVSVKNKKRTFLTLDIKPALSNLKLENRLIREVEANPKKDFIFLIKQLVPNQLTGSIVRLSGIDPKKRLTTLTANDRSRVVSVLKGIKFEITGYRGWDEAIVTAGGVATREIDSGTLESKLIKGLYFAGEVLDLDANTGGYNLQIAFSTGWLAGESAAKAIQIT